MNRLTVAFLVVSLLQLQEAAGANVACTNQPGLSFTACEGGGPQTSVVSAPGSGNPYTLLGCCAPHTHTGPATGYFEFPGGAMDLVILCAKMDPEKPITIKTFHCTPNGACRHATLSNAARYPMVIPINGPRFRISGGTEISFMVTNTADGNCACPTQCATGWMKRGAYCYRISDTALGFHQQDDRCGTLHPGAHLSSLHSAAERDWVNSNVKTVNRNYWIGLFDVKLGSGNPRGWEWTDCTPYDYNNWSNGEPNDFAGAEDCAEQYINLKWNDIACTRTHWGICKYYLGPQ